MYFKSVWRSIKRRAAATFTINKHIVGALASWYTNNWLVGTNSNKTPLSSIFLNLSLTLRGMNFYLKVYIFLNFQVPEVDAGSGSDLYKQTNIY